MKTVLDKVAFSVAHQIRHYPLLKADLPDTLALQLDLSGLDEMDDIDADTYAAALDAALIVAEDAGERAELFNVVNTRALAFSKRRAAEMVADVTDSTRDMLRDIIASGIEDKLTRDQIADLITRQDDSVFSEDRAELIANTEISIANGEGALDSYKEIKALGINIMKEWLPDDEPCPTCQANADQGPIDVEADFDSGDQTSPAHPRCECTTISVYPTEGEE